MRIEGYLRERQRAIGQFRHRIIKAQTAYVAVGRYAHGKRKLARKMERAVTRDSGQALKADVIINVCNNIIENAAKPNVIEGMRGEFSGRARSAIAMLSKESGRERQRGGFDVHATGSRLIGKLGED